MSQQKKKPLKLHGLNVVRVYVDGYYRHTATWAAVRRECANHAMAPYRLIDIEADPADIPCVHVITNSTTR